MTFIKFKTYITIIFLTCFIYACNSGDLIYETDSNIPDIGFRTYLKTLIPNAFDGETINKDSDFVKTLEKIDISVNKNIISLSGISLFTNLRTLNLVGLPKLEELNVSGLQNLKTLKCVNTSIRKLSFLNNKVLSSIDCSTNGLLLSIDLSELTALKTLNCSYSSIETLKFNNNDHLENLNCSNNKISQLDLSKLTQLTVFNCSENRVIRIDMRSSKLIKVINIEPKNSIINSLVLLSIHEKIKQYEAIKNAKSIRGNELTISTYDDNNAVICVDYLPNLEQCAK